MTPEHSFPIGRRFTAALHNAVHDASHELKYIERVRSGAAGSSTIKLLHYWDTDNLFWPAFGFMGQPEPIASEEDRVAQALFSAGFLGQVTLTAAHRLEFYTLLSKWAAHRRVDDSVYQTELRRFVERKKLDRVLLDLTTSFNSIRSNDDSELQAALERLENLRPITFAYVESMDGTWVDRVGRLLGQEPMVDVTNGGPSTEEILASDLFQDFVSALSKERDPQRTVSTAIDAAALTAIALMNEPGRGRETGAYPRFYTSSRNLQKLFRSHQWIQDAFSFEFTTHDGKPATGSVWRDGYSYLLRAVLPVLAPQNSARPTIDSGPTLEELQQLSEALHEALESGDRELRKLAASWRFSDGTTVDSLIENLESTAMRLVWLRYDIAPAAQRMVSGLKAIHELGTSAATRRLAGKFLDEAEEVLRFSMSDLGLSVRITTLIMRAWKNVHERGDGRPVSLVDDLGAIHWGIPVSDRSSDAVRLPGQDGEHPRLEDVLLFSDIQSLRDSPEKAERAIAIALALDHYEIADRLCSALDAGGKFATESLWLMAAVATIRSRGTRPGFDHSAFFGRIRMHYDGLVRSEQARLSIGYGYAAFYLWREASVKSLIEMHPSDPHGWAQWSVSIVEENIDSYSDIQRRFAVNRVVYVASVANLTIPHLSDRLVELESICRESDANYRFLDTLGYREYLKALRSFPAVVQADSDSVAEWFDQYHEALERGTEYLELAHRRAPRDATVRGHLHSATRLVEDVKRAIAIREATEAPL